MSLINHLLTQKCQIATTTYNSYGEQTQSFLKTVECKFRELTELDRNANREQIMSDGIFWFKPEESVIEGTIIKFESKYYRVVRLVKARRIKGNTVHFLKCMVNMHEPINEVS